MYVCKISSLTKRKSFEGNKENIEVLKANTKCWFVDPKGAKLELIGYSNSDYEGCKVERRSTLGTCQLLGRSLVSWSSKKQNSIALSTAKAEYIAVGSCCAQILWMKATLKDFEINFKQVPLLCDNESAVKLTNKPGSTLKNKAHRCLPSLHKRSPTKRGHLH